MILSRVVGLFVELFSGGGGTWDLYLVGVLGRRVDGATNAFSNINDFLCGGLVLGFGTFVRSDDPRASSTVYSFMDLFSADGTL